MTLQELIKNRPTRQHPDVLPLVATLGETLTNTPVRGSRHSALAMPTAVEIAKANPLYKRANLPDRAVEVVSLDTRPEAWMAARQAALETCQAGGMVLLCGPRWTGKTVLATSIAISFLQRNRGAVYTRGIGLLKDLRLDFNSNDMATRELVKPYQRWHLLVIDEVGLRVRGESGYSESDAALLTDLIDQRYANRLATIFISNEDQKATFEKVGPSITRRIEEDGIVIEANWPSFGN